MKPNLDLVTWWAAQVGFAYYDRRDTGCEAPFIRNLDGLRKALNQARDRKVSRKKRLAAILAGWPEMPADLQSQVLEFYCEPVNLRTSEGILMIDGFHPGSIGARALAAADRKLQRSEAG